MTDSHNLLVPLQQILITSHMTDVNNLFFNHATSTEEGCNVNLSSMTQFIEAYSRLSCLSTFAIDFDRHELIYRSEQLVYIDESTVKDIKRDCANPYWSLITEETLEKLLLIKNNYLMPGQELSDDEYLHHVCTIDYPIMLRNHELFITQKFTPLIMRSDGITKAGLFTINYSNKKEMESSIITPSGKRFRFSFEENRYVEYDLGITLSLVEKAILHRARMGMTNEEIAQSLYVSINTVKTHRMRIFKKLHVDTITEALAVIGNYQLV